MQGDNLPNSIFISRLNSAIRSKGWKPVELGRRAELASGTISRYLSGDRRPGAEDLYRVAKTLGVSMEWLLGYGDDKKCELEDNEYSEHPSHTLRETLDVREEGLTLPQELLDRLDALAEDLGVDRQIALRIAAKKGLDKLAGLDTNGRMHDLMDRAEGLAADIMDDSLMDDDEPVRHSGKNAG